MNTGTKIRTALAIATSINMAIAAMDVAQFGNETANTIYKIFSMIANAIVVGLVAYYNNDYTKVAAEHTGAMRQEKAEQKENYVGEKFFEDVEDHEEADDE